MISLKYIRENQDTVQKNINFKKVDFDLKDLINKDEQWRLKISKCEKLKSIRNSVSKDISKLKSSNSNAERQIKEMKIVSLEIKELDKQIDSLKNYIDNKILFLPNLVHSSVPIGESETDNKVIKVYSKKPTFDFEIKDHIQISDKLNLLDMKRGAKIAGSGFPLFIGNGSRLERALIAFMLDKHTQNGYTELFPPFLSTQDTTQVTGQLPKFEEDMYFMPKDELYCIPTAEVPVTSFYKNEVLEESVLPQKFAAYSACFRREAGSYGKDTRGLLRVHQFNKVELVKFVRPSNSYSELESLLLDAESILKMLNLHYRVVEINSSDLSFSASKCYDIEVWSPSEKKYLEVSSCSNFESFQARRGNIKFRNKDNKLEYVHTLNGSGLATPRLMVALLETYQQSDGSIIVPDVLQDYLKLSKINA